MRNLTTEERLILSEARRIRRKYRTTRRRVNEMADWGSIEVPEPPRDRRSVARDAIILGRVKDLSGKDLSWADLDFANLADADFSGANLRDASLVNANLEGANFEGADLREANLFGAYLLGANFEGADLEGASMPKGWAHETAGQPAVSPDGATSLETTSSQ